VGAALMRHLAAVARAAGLKQLIAEGLSENATMLKVFKKSGAPHDYGPRGRRRAGCSAGDLKAHASVVVAPQGQKTAATMNPALAYVGTYH
jgi:hypothetical protein